MGDGHLGGISSGVLAVAVQHLDLAPDDVDRAHHVDAVRVASGQPERAPLAATPDHDRDVRLQRPGVADRLGHVQHPPVERLGSGTPEPRERDQRVLQERRTARPRTGSRCRRPRALARTTRARCRTGPDRSTARRGWRSSWPAARRGAGRPPRPGRRSWPWWCSPRSRPAPCRSRASGPSPARPAGSGGRGPSPRCCRSLPARPRSPWPEARRRCRPTGTRRCAARCAGPSVGRPPPRRAAPTRPGGWRPGAPARAAAPGRSPRRRGGPAPRTTAPAAA